MRNQPVGLLLITAAFLITLVELTTGIVGQIEDKVAIIDLESRTQEPSWQSEEGFFLEIVSPTPSESPGSRETQNVVPTASPPNIPAVISEPVISENEVPVPVPTNTVLVPAPSAEFLELEAVLSNEILAYETSSGSNIAIAITDLQSGESIDVGGGEIHRTGCVINFFSLLALVSRLQEIDGDGGPYEALITNGISASNPAAVTQFLTAEFGSREAGEAYARAVIARLSLGQTVFDHVPLYGDMTNYVPNTTTVTDTNTAMRKLWRRELLNPTWSDYTLEKMREIANWGLRYMIPGQLPVGATVAHKIGYFADSDGWVQNNIGIVTFIGDDGQEKAYAVSILTEKSATEHGAAFFGAHLSKLSWDYFQTKY